MALDVPALVAVGWPGEKMQTESGAARVYMTIRRLRAAGSSGRSSRVATAMHWTESRSTIARAAVVPAFRYAWRELDPAGATRRIRTKAMLEVCKTLVITGP